MLRRSAEELICLRFTQFVRNCAAKQFRTFYENACDGSKLDRKDQCG
jgi:hypothetical protein